MDDALDDPATRTADDFESLFASQFGRLARLVRRVVNDTAEAEDLAADVLWKCFRRRPEAINLEGWLSRVAIRAALDSIRRKARRSRYESFWPLGTRVAKPDELLERDRDGERVRQVLAAIKPQFATLLGPANRRARLPRARQRAGCEARFRRHAAGSRGVQFSKGIRETPWLSMKRHPRGHTIGSQRWTLPPTGGRTPEPHSAG